MSVEIVGIVVGILITVDDGLWFRIIALPIIIFLLCAVFLSQCLYYECWHTWSLINSWCNPMRGSRLNILEEEFLELDKTGEKDDHDSHPTECKTRLHYSCGFYKDSTEEEKVMENFGRGSSKSLQDMGYTSDKTERAKFATI